MDVLGIPDKTDEEGLLLEGITYPRDESVNRRLAPRRPWFRRESWLLLLVAAAYGLVQPLLFHMHRFFGYDEAVYVSQVYPAVPVDFFTAPRARGLPWLIYPVAAFSPPLVVIRYYMALVSSVLLFLGFRAWVPVLRMRAVAAALLFAAGWLSLFYATEVFPNLPVALGDIAAAGYLAQHLSPRFDDRTRRGALIKAAAAVLFIAIVRPTEATFFALGVLVVSVTLNRRMFLMRCVVIGGGLVVGWLPWVIEACLKYGGFFARMRAASENVEGGFYPANIWHHLTLTDGPLTGTADKSAPILGWLWWLLLVIGIVLAIRNLAKYRDRTASVAAFGGIASAAQYLLFTGVVEARFLLPGYGLLTVCLVAALPSMPVARVRRLTAWTAVILAFAIFAGWNVRTAREVDNQQYTDGQSVLELGHALRDIAQNRPCIFVSQYSFAEISMASGCIGSTFNHVSYTWVSLVSDPGQTPVYVLSVTDPARLRIRPVPGTVRKIQRPGMTVAWWLFVVPRNEVVVTGGRAQAAPLACP